MYRYFYVPCLCLRVGSYTSLHFNRQECGHYTFHFDVYYFVQHFHFKVLFEKLYKKKAWLSNVKQKTMICEQPFYTPLVLHNTEDHFGTKEQHHGLLQKKTRGLLVPYSIELCVRLQTTRVPTCVSAR